MFRYLGKVVWHRPRTVFALATLLLVCAGIGFYGYVLYEWHSARVALKEGRISEAKAKLGLCLMVWPRSVEVRVLVARVARITGDFPEAEAQLHRCLELAHGSTGAIELEFLLMRAQTGQEDEVAPALMNIVEAGHPEAPLILETLSRAYMYNLRYRPAYALLNRWIEEEPESAQPYFLRGWVQERMNNRTSAMEDYKRAAELNPDLVPARLRVAELYLEKSNPLEAQPHLELLHEQFPDRADVMARLGQCRLLQGRVSEARPLLDAAVEKLPDDPTLLINLAKLELYQARPAQAEVWLRRVLKDDPSDSEAQYILFSSLQLQNRHKEADAVMAEHQKSKELLRKADKLLQDEADHPTASPDIPAEAGALLLRMGQERLGLHWLHQALDRDPKHQPTHKLLAEYYDKKGDKQKAATHRRRLVTLEPVSP